MPKLVEMFTAAIVLVMMLAIVAIGHPMRLGRKPVAANGQRHPSAGTSCKERRFPSRLG